MGNYKRLLSNTAILGAGTFASKVLVLLLMPFYTSILSAAEFGAAAPKILAVTVLTSMDGQDLMDVGIAGRTPAEQVSAMAKFAVENGANGLVCSPREVKALSQSLASGTLFVTPGVRPAGSAVGDQKRVATPADAVRDGATHLVVGRPILAADDPVAAAAAILAEMAS